MFKNEQDEDFAMVMNRDHDNSHTATVQFQEEVSEVQIFDEQTDTWSSLSITGTFPNQQVQFSMGPSYGKLLAITKAVP